MPITYHCDNCEVTASSLGGWLIVSINFIHDVPNSPPPGGRMLDLTAPDLLFHDAVCRDAWCAKASVAPPPAAA